MRVLLLVDCYCPSKKSSAKLIHDLAIELGRRGHQAIVMTPSEAISEIIEVCTEEGVCVVRLKTGRIKGATNVARAFREALLPGTLWRGARNFLRQNSCDLILFYSPTIFFGSLVRRLKQLWQCPAYLILRDIFPDWALDTGVLRKGLVSQFFHRVAAQQYRIADVIAVQSQANLKYLARAFPQERLPLEVLFNWTALDESPLMQSNYRARLELQDKIVFLYGGNLGVAQDMDNILRLAIRLAFRSDIHLLLVGEGSEVPRLKKSIETNGLRNLQIISGMAQQDYLSMVSEFDVGLISLDARLMSHNIPGKLLGYLYWGKPALASVNPGNDLFWMLREHQAGLCLLNGDDDGLFDAALRLADDARLRHAMGQNGRRLLEKKFSVEDAVTHIFKHLFERSLLPLSPNPQFASSEILQFRAPELAAKR